MDFDYAMLLSRYDNIMNRRNQGREILYGDLFWSPLGAGFDYNTAARQYGETLSEMSGKSSAFEELDRLAVLLFKILQKKVPLFYIRDIYEKKDMEGARNAGAAAILINRTDEQKAYGQDYEIRNLREILEIIR